MDHNRLTTKGLLALPKRPDGSRELSNGDHVWVYGTPSLGIGVQFGDRGMIGRGTQLGDRVRLGYLVGLGSDVIVGDNTLLSCRTNVKSRAEIGSYVELYNVKVGNNAIIDSCVHLMGVTVPNGANVTCEAFTLQLDWGTALITPMRKGGWRIAVGCRCFTYKQAVKHWENREDRPKTRRALPYIYEEAVARGWEKPKKKGK